MPAAPVAPGAADADTRRLPSYAAGEVEVAYVLLGREELIARDTYWAEHSHPTHELLWNRRGASTARVGNRVWAITPAAGLWIPAGTPHSGRTPAGTWHCAAQLSIHAAPSIADGPTAVEMTPLLRLLLDRLDEGGLSAESRAKTEALVLDVLAPAEHPVLVQSPEAPLLAPIVAAAAADPADSTTLEGWSARLGVSARTITRTFRAETGLGFSRWLLTLRVQQAIALLARGDEVEQVAAHVGYHSASAFGAAFRRVTGTSPARFRAQ
ncbi:AraC family transcriptional regulator [Nocardiopsis coralliicola]